MRRTLRRLGPLAALAAALAWAGCTDEGSLHPNLPPETTLAVGGQGDLAPTHYMQILSWHGEDPDGNADSLHFEYRWTLDPAIDPGDFPTDWVGTTRPFIYATGDTFYLPVPTAWSDTVSHAFEVRAVDEDGLRDETPAGAVLPVYNAVPRLVAVAGDDTTSALVLPDSILPVLSVQFRVYDPDNPAPEGEDQSAFIREIRVWFEDENDYFTVPGSDTLLTLLPEDFAGRMGLPLPVHLQAVDWGGSKSNVLVDTTWVRNLEDARILILDSADAFSPTVTTVDPYWHDSVPALLGPGDVYLHDFEADGELGHPDVLVHIFALFEAVFWYNGGAGAADSQYASEPTPALTAAESGLLAYLETGGKVLLTGYNLIGRSTGTVAGGSFSVEFEEEVLRADSLYVHNTQTPGNVETSNWQVWPPTADIPGFPAAGTETLKNNTALRGVDRMSLNPGALGDGLIEELYRLDADAVRPSSLFAGSVGVRRYFESGGELVLLTFPISLAYGYGNHVDQMEAFLVHFGILP